MEETRRLQAETEGRWRLQAETASVSRLGLKELSFATSCETEFEGPRLEPRELGGSRFRRSLAALG